jgi:hypothetical protein
MLAADNTLVRATRGAEPTGWPNVQAEGALQANNNSGAGCVFHSSRYYVGVGSILSMTVLLVLTPAVL